MKLARYLGQGQIGILEEPAPALPSGGIRVGVEACGLCSGELMSWYMDKKVPHVLGHEVAGVILESESPDFPVGQRVFVHHHAPCLDCDECRKGHFVHCARWRATKLVPGGMATEFVAGPDQFSDAALVPDLRAIDAALIEPIACVQKSIRLAQLNDGDRIAVVGAGSLGIAHALLLPGAIVFESNPSRRENAIRLGLEVLDPGENARSREFDTVFILPGSVAASELAFQMVRPGGTLVYFTPLEPGSTYPFTQADAYFLDLTIKHSYSCGPNDTAAAINSIRAGKITAEQLVSDFVDLEQLPEAYEKMKQGQILKAMVVFS